MFANKIEGEMMNSTRVVSAEMFRAGRDNFPVKKGKPRGAGVRRAGQMKRASCLRNSMRSTATQCEIRKQRSAGAKLGNLGFKSRSFILRTTGSH